MADVLLDKLGDIHSAIPALEVAATFVIASLSWRYVEEPIRQGALGRLWHQFRSGAASPVRSAALSAASSGTLSGGHRGQCRDEQTENGQLGP